jgi:molecular chaperone GrpE
MADERTGAPETGPVADAREGEGSDQRVDALAREAADYKDRLLRTLAEMENLRKRTEREIGDARQYAVTNFARDMLTVSDNLKRAIAAVPAEARNGVDPALDALIEGVAVTERGLEQTLTKHGIRQLDDKGQKFDPTRHQAMYEVETPAMAPGMVADVIQAGYVIGDRVLRPALVAVSKAAKGAPAPANDDRREPAEGTEG